MEPRQSRIVGVVSLFETYLKVSIHVGVCGALFVGSGFLLYIVMGTTADALGWLNPPYPFLSLESDPFFIIGGAVVGLFIVQSAGSLLLYHFLVGVEDDKSEFAVLMGFISLGFGGALLQVTLPTALRHLLNLL